MMRCVSAAGLLLLACSVAAAQGDAKAIITRGLQAAGKPADNKAYHETWKETGSIAVTVPPMAGRPAMDMTMQYETDWAYEAPDKYRFQMKGEFQVKNPPPGQAPAGKAEMTVVSNGKRAIHMAGPRKEEMQGPRLEEAAHSAYQFWVASLRPLLHDTAFTLTAVGEREFGGKAVVSVKVSRTGQRDVTLHFDKQTGLLAGCSDRVKNEFEGWKDAAQDTEFDTYEKAASGELTFRRMTVKRDGKVLLQSRLSDYQRSETLRPDLFKID